jgi:hypothetical protein
MNGKKGILFTLTTIFLLLAVLLLSTAYLSRNKELQRIATLSLAGDRLRYIQDDIGDGVHAGLLGTTAFVSREDGAIKVTLQQANISSSNNPLPPMSRYEAFVESVYAAQNNMQINISGFNNSFTIEPYGSRAEMEGSTFTLYTGNAAALQNISVQAAVSETRAIDYDGKPSSDLGGHLISVEFYQGGSRIYSRSSTQDPSEDNTEFYQQFRESGPPVVHNVSGIYVQFGRHNGQDGVLRIWVDNLDADMTGLDITYTEQAEKARVIGGNISIAYPMGNMTKESAIIIAEG